MDKKETNALNQFGAHLQRLGLARQIKIVVGMKFTQKINLKTLIHIEITTYSKCLRGKAREAQGVRRII